MSDFAPNSIGPAGSRAVYQSRLDPSSSQHAVAARNQPSSDSASRGLDRVEISTTAELLDRLVRGDTMRNDIVAQIRAEISNGSYESPDKLDAAIDDLMSDL